MDSFSADGFFNFFKQILEEEEDFIVAKIVKPKI